TTHLAALFGHSAGTTGGHLAALRRAGLVSGAQSYQEAWLACRFLAARFGEDRLVRLYRDARRLGVERALPLPSAELVAGWRAYLREELE
ncbi:hypothetical protein AB0K48_60920, partial [Nonomuraea sp. NPDC055795]